MSSDRTKQICRWMTIYIYIWRIMNSWFSFSRKVNILWGNQKITIYSFWMELVIGKFQRISRHLYNFQFTLFKQKSGRHCSLVWFKEECILHRIDCPLGRKPGGGTRYETLRADCVEKGWICHVIPIEVSCHGFLGHSVILFLSKIEITGRNLKVASNHFQTMAQYASSWIWSKAKSLQHKWKTRGTTRVIK